MGEFALIAFLLIIGYCLLLAFKGGGKRMVCRNCGSIGQSFNKTRGSIGIEIVLWLMFIVPGLIYSLWRISTRKPACRTCGSDQLIPPDSPLGRQLSAQSESKAVMSMALAAASLGILIAADPATAQTLNKCTDANGRIVYQDTPCAHRGTTVHNWDRPTREQQLEAENRMLREQLNRRQARENHAPYPRAPQRTRADLRAERANSQECREATRSFENATFSQSRTWSSVEAARRAMDIACGAGF